MTDDDAAETGTAPDDDGPSGAFVVRIWHERDGLRARVRHTADVRDESTGDQVALLHGPRELVIGDLVGRLHQWAERFAAGSAATGEDHGGRSCDPADGAMTPE